MYADYKQCTVSLEGTGLIWHTSNAQFVHALITLLHQQPTSVIVHEQTNYYMTLVSLLFLPTLIKNNLSASPSGMEPFIEH